MELFKVGVDASSQPHPRLVFVYSRFILLFISYISFFLIYYYQCFNYVFNFDVIFCSFIDIFLRNSVGADVAG